MIDLCTSLCTSDKSMPPMFRWFDNIRGSPMGYLQTFILTVDRTDITFVLLTYSGNVIPHPPIPHLNITFILLHLPSASHVFRALPDHSQALPCRSHHHPLPSPHSMPPPWIPNRLCILLCLTYSTISLVRAHQPCVHTSLSKNVKRQQTSNGPRSAAQCPYNAILIPQAGNLIRA